MFDLNKRRAFKTVGELKDCLKDIPDNVEVNICGDNYCFYHEEQDKSCICLDYEDLEDSYSATTGRKQRPSARRMETVQRDLCLERYWREFVDIPMNPETERIEVPFLSFPVGTYREEILGWFDTQHSLGVAWLMYMGV